MKRYVYAGSAVTFTGVLVMLAMAVAQRDARVEDSAPNESSLPYANQTAQPIAIHNEELPSNSGWPPAPTGISPAIIRANDAPADQLPNSPFPPSMTSRASLTSYSTNADGAGTGTLPGKLAEPPPLADLESFAPSLPAGLANALPSQSQTSSPYLPSSPISPLPTSTRLSDTNEPPPLRNSLPSSNTGLPPLPQNSYTAAPGTFHSGLGDNNATSPQSTAPQSTSPPFLPQSTSLSSEPTSSPFATASSSPVPLASPQRNEPLAPPIATFGTPVAPSTPADLRSTSNPQIKTTANVSSPAFSSPAPGIRQLDGSQNPSMEIQKRAPNEVQVGIPATFTVLVRNVGNATAFEVNVVDSVPKGAKLVRTSPTAQASSDQSLTWKLGEMPAGSEQVLTIELIPETEGEIGSVASVNFAAQASVRTMSTQPKLVVKQIFEPVVLASDSVRILIEVSNVGSGTARNVRLQEDVPANLRHETGSQSLQRELGDMAPGEIQKLDIDLTAMSAGKVANMLKVVADNASSSESSATIEVVAPKLELAVEGAGLRYLERQVTYRIAAHNAGSAIATNVEIVLYLPSGMQFNSTINAGSYFPTQHAVRWELDEIAAGGNAVTEVTLMPVEEGNFVLRLQSTADNVRAQPIEKAVRVEGQSELSFSIEDDNDPIETDGRTTYIVKISNIGTRSDHNVELNVELPEGASVEQVHAPVEYKVSQRNLIFAPLNQLQAKDQQTMRFSVRHAREGIHVVKAQLRSKLRPTPVSKEESTEVYRDR